MSHILPVVQRLYIELSQGSSRGITKKKQCILDIKLGLFSSTTRCKREEDISLDMTTYSVIRHCRRRSHPVTAVLTVQSASGSVFQDPSTIPDDADVTAELQIDMSGGVKDITSSPRPSANGDSSTHHSYGERTGSLQNSTRLRALTVRRLWPIKETTLDKANCLNDYLVSTPEDHQTASTGATFFRMSVPHAVVTTGISNLHNFVVRLLFFSNCHSTSWTGAETWRRSNSTFDFSFSVPYFEAKIGIQPHFDVIVFNWIVGSSAFIIIIIISEDHAMLQAFQLVFSQPGIVRCLLH
ncbi:hypothetical protein BD769DRAFT_1381992 [Suillus cothurnatus]|nr:hypothetical protein BD769DRAFT_1381992 [Suillus cothurnatus]